MYNISARCWLWCLTSWSIHRPLPSQMSVIFPQLCHLMGVDIIQSLIISWVILMRKKLSQHHHLDASSQCIMPQKRIWLSDTRRVHNSWEALKVRAYRQLSKDYKDHALFLMPNAPRETEIFGHSVSAIILPECESKSCCRFNTAPEDNAQVKTVARNWGKFRQESHLRHGIRRR